MFTGIIEQVGRIESIEDIDGDRSIKVSASDFGHVQVGDSVSVNGVCLTATKNHGLLQFDVSVETLSRTLIGTYQSGDKVNLEHALTLSTPLGGHLVSGHVDGIARIESMEPSARSVVYRLTAPTEFARFIVPKGSVCVDGISLTVNAVEDTDDAVCFEVNIVPHTLSNTNLVDLDCGAAVHLEVDQVARYLDRILSFREKP
ncbi:MAG: riboflavin synthase subunit alpha [marine bacterium B5-7]|nr:MAG: riboflavin synthase subunit alpha [marine bacterium B5-7]